MLYNFDPRMPVLCNSLLDDLTLHVPERLLTLLAITDTENNRAAHDSKSGVIVVSSVERGLII